MNCSHERQDPCGIDYFNLSYFEGSESFSFILCLLVEIDIGSLLHNCNRTTVGTLIVFNGKLRVRVKGLRES